MDIRLKILEDREKKIQVIHEKMNSTSNFFITIKGNICGEDKNIKITNILTSLYLNEVLKSFNVLSYDQYSSYDGNYYLVEISDKNPVEVKKKLIYLESIKIGRFIDLDLYSNNQFKSISRKDLNLPSRLCIICNNNYNICLREKKHSKEEVVSKSIKLVKSYLVDTLVNYTVDSLKSEINAHPKFGLVTKKSNGKHKDMDYNTFLVSIEAIKPYLYEYAKEGFTLNNSTFNKLREIGKNAESAMLRKTNGINTYKGVIFLFGLLLPSIVDVIYNKKSFDQVKENIKFLSRDILDDFKNLKYKNDLTYGEEIYIKYGITGIRGVAKSGIDIAFVLLEKFIYDESDENTLVINILMNVMILTDDTVILHNKPIEILDYVKRKIAYIISIGGCNSEEGIKEINTFTKKCIELNISPGGSADLVSIILTLIKVKKEYFWGV